MVPRTLSEGRDRAPGSLLGAPRPSCGGHCDTRWACSSRRQESTFLPTVMRRQLCCNSGAHRCDPSFLPSLEGATNPQSTCACLRSWPQTARPSPWITHLFLPLHLVHGDAGSLSAVLTLMGGLPRLQVIQMQGPGLAGCASDWHVCAEA